MQINVEKIVFIGAGNMAEALVKGLVKSGAFPAERIWVTDVLPEKREALRERYGVNETADNVVAVGDASVVVLAVKPQIMGEVLTGLAGALNPDALVISIAAGLRSARFQEWLGAATRVVRVMPNTPALVGEGAAAISAGEHARPEDLDLAEALMSAVGIVTRVAEYDMDAVTAVSGSGPAYVFYLIEAMTAAAREHGLDADVARALVLATVKGAAQLAMESDVDAEELRRRVTSKGGTTEAAINHLESQKVRRHVVDAIAAAKKRSLELSA